MIPLNVPGRTINIPYDARVHSPLCMRTIRRQLENPGALVKHLSTVSFHFHLTISNSHKGDGIWWGRYVRKGTTIPVFPEFGRRSMLKSNVRTTMKKAINNKVSYSTYACYNTSWNSSTQAVTTRVYSTTCLTRIGSAAPCSPATFGRIRIETCLSNSVSGPFIISKENFRMRTDRTACVDFASDPWTNKRKIKHTLNSARANPLPKHILGPSENVSKCLWPWMSPGIFGFSSSHRSGTNDFALRPQNFSLRLVKTIGECNIVPLGITREFKVCPVAVSIGALSGITSSSTA